MPTPQSRLLVLAILLCVSCPGRAGELRAAPWPTVSILPGYLSLDAMLYMEDCPELAGEAPALEKKAEAGDAEAMEVLATLYRKRGGDDMAKAMAWYRRSVRSGDVTSAIILGRMLFPLAGGARSEFEVPPDVVRGYCWLAIGLAGLAPEGRPADARQERGGELTGDIDEDFLLELAGRLARDLEGLDRILLPSERARIAGVLAEWPDKLPPDIDAVGEPDEAGESLPDEREFVDLVVRMVRGEVIGARETRRMSMAAEDEDGAPVRERAYELVRRRAESGDDEGRYLLAWFTLYGIGVPEDSDSALPVIRERAARGDPRANFDMAVVESRRGNDAGYLEHVTKSAEAGYAYAMPLLSGHFRKAGDDGNAARWMERAAAGGVDAGIMSLVEAAERQNDIHGIIKWMTVAILRADSPEKAYRGHVILAYFADVPAGMRRRAMEEGERWHAAYPRPEP